MKDWRSLLMRTRNLLSSIHFGYSSIDGVNVDRPFVLLLFVIDVNARVR